ncbi:hypothetical protein V1477_021214 [Vespula maculifrons]|uniref:Uncharacterized protein n=1 Tax=Vespula maculifrons TaxID=7453 RepID=A0ABD2AJ86_VESMC
MAFRRHLKGIICFMFEDTQHFKKLDEIRNKLVISDLFVPHLLKSSIQVDGCYRNSLAMATC